MRNYPSARRSAPPASTATPAATAIYSPPRDGFPYMAAVFSPNGTVEAFQPFPTQLAAQAFLQAFMQEGAGVHGLYEPAR